MLSGTKKVHTRLCLACWPQVEEFERLVKLYLASIPVPDDGEPEPISLKDITPLPGSFPQGITTEDVRCATVHHRWQKLAGAHL